ncbi:hypothetical protein Tco_0339582 [Tanacetum coccineum]
MVPMRSNSFIANAGRLDEVPFGGVFYIVSNTITLGAAIFHISPYPLRESGSTWVKSFSVSIITGTKVWWYGDVCLKEKFKRLFNLELQKDAFAASKFQMPNVVCSFRRPPRSGIENSQLLELVQMLSSVSLSSASDRWSWTLHALGEFSVKSAREEIDKHVLVVSPSHSRWSKVLPIKLDVFCGALDLARLIGRWWNIHIPSFGDPPSWEMWFNGLNLSSLQKGILEATFVSMWWHIWKFRNSSLFSLKKPRKEMIFEDIVSHTFFWVNHRCRKFNVSKVAWLNDPLNAL